MKILAKLRQAVIHCNVNLRGLGTDESHRHVLEQPVEALEPLNPVVSLRHIGSIIDLDDMTKGLPKYRQMAAVISAVRTPPLTRPPRHPD